MTIDHHAVGRRRFLALGVLTLPAALTACSQVQPTVSGRAYPVDELDLSSPHPSTQVSAPAVPVTAIDPGRYAGQVPNTWGTDLHGIESTVTVSLDGPRTIALTLDACGGPHGSALDTALLNTLTEFDVPATVFLNERWVLANPRQTDQLIANPLLRVENHGSQHVPLSVTGQAAYGIAGTTDPAGVVEEIESNRAVLRSAGVVSSWFRAGTAHYDDVAVAIARDLGVRLAGFSVNADFGSTAPPSVVEKQLLSAPDGAIVLAHMNQPASGTAAGLRAALSTLVRDRVRFVHLDPEAQ